MTPNRTEPDCLLIDLIFPARKTLAMPVIIHLDTVITSPFIMPFSRGMLPLPKNREELRLLVERHDIATIRHYLDLLTELDILTLLMLSCFHHDREIYLIDLTYLTPNDRYGKYLRSCMGVIPDIVSDIAPGVASLPDVASLPGVAPNVASFPAVAPNVASLPIALFDNTIPLRWVALGLALNWVHGDHSLTDDKMTHYRLNRDTVLEYVRGFCRLSSRYPEREVLAQDAIKTYLKFSIGDVFDGLLELAVREKAEVVVNTVIERRLQRAEESRSTQTVQMTQTVQITEAELHSDVSNYMCEKAGARWVGPGNPAGNPNGMYLSWSEQYTYDIATSTYTNEATIGEQMVSGATEATYTTEGQSKEIRMAMADHFNNATICLHMESGATDVNMDDATLQGLRYLDLAQPDYTPATIATRRDNTPKQ
jgi:hypothetical protein